jgi:Na+/H+ antiporter NhaD/arsenite permease-like protein
MAELFAASLFVAGYAAIAMEHRLFVNKAATSLVLAALLWVVAGVSLTTEEVQHSLSAVSVDIFGLIVFLLTAMTLVEILIHYRFFDYIERGLRKRAWTQYQLGWALAAIAFVFSAFIDNLTTTIVAIQIARRMFTSQTRLVIGALVVIAANAGGAFSPIGDVTTLMLWFAKKFTAWEVMWQGFLPSLTLALVAGFILLQKVKKEPCDEGEEYKNGIGHASRSDKAIIAATLGSFLLPLGAAQLGLPPYMGLITGLGIVWLLIDLLKRARPQETHLQANIRRFFQQTDLESIQFFLGILLAVGALHALGLLDIFMNALLGFDPSVQRLAVSFAGLGVGSAIVDNVPLTAAVISTLDYVPSQLWVLLALAVGTGGSLLVIGSAAGVIAMGMMPELTFGKYLKIGTIPALLGFMAAMLVWTIQYIWIL